MKKNYIVLVDFGDEGYYYAEDGDRGYFTTEKEDARVFDNAQEAAGHASSLQGYAIPVEGGPGLPYISPDVLPKQYINKSG